MLIDIVEVEFLEAYKLKLRFEDGATGVIDLEGIIEFTGVFEPLRNPEFFSQVTVNPEYGTICWPNDADLDPDVLYALVTGMPIPEISVPTTESIES
ncbi:MAG: DUF2442 domain-containing protein [Chloroflexota bacterium]|jgi:hypothetical protein